MGHHLWCATTYAWGLWEGRPRGHHLSLRAVHAGMQAAGGPSTTLSPPSTTHVAAAKVIHLDRLAIVHSKTAHLRLHGSITRTPGSAL